MLETGAFRRLKKKFGAVLVTDLLREALDLLRGQILDGRLDRAALRHASKASVLARRVAAAAGRSVDPSPRRVVNATGVVVHTNLGRAILADAAAEAVARAASGYMDLEYDLESGGRGSRLDHLEPAMSRLFPGHGFVVVNNNAAAVMLALRALAEGKEAIVSRGELVEIGGSFRIPDVMAASGARLKEVGTTNRTRLSDYRTAISRKTGLILKVHTSNFKIVGFTEDVKIGSLARLATKAGLPLVVDWGSGDLVDLGPLGIHDELPVRKILDEGADVVTFSGDKLLGGPQAGFAVGAPELIARMRKDPLARVCRLDRLMVSALQRTLSAYVRGRAFEEVPTLRMLALSPREIGKRADKVRKEVARRSKAGKRLSVEDGVSRTGGGSSPMGERPTRLLVVRSRSGDAAGLERALRLGDPPVIGRVREGHLLLDLRTVSPDQDPVVIERLSRVLLDEE